MANSCSEAGNLKVSIHSILQKRKRRYLSFTSAPRKILLKALQGGDESVIKSARQAYCESSQQHSQSEVHDRIEIAKVLERAGVDVNYQSLVSLCERYYKSLFSFLPTRTITATKLNGDIIKCQVQIGSTIRCIKTNIAQSAGDHAFNQCLWGLDQTEAFPNDHKIFTDTSFLLTPADIPKGKPLKQYIEAGYLNDKEAHDKSTLLDFIKLSDAQINDIPCSIDAIRAIKTEFNRWLVCLSQFAQHTMESSGLSCDLFQWDWQHEAAFNRHLPYFKNMKDRQQKSPIHHVLAHSEYWINIRHHAAEFREWQLALVQRLEKAGADLNAQDAAGQTPLHIAIADSGQEDEINEVIVLLLSLGVDMNIKNNMGKSALDIAREKNLDNIVRLLEGSQNSDGLGAGPRARV